MRWLFEELGGQERQRDAPSSVSNNYREKNNHDEQT